MSSAMALRAASLISSGAAKSGNPWDRLTAPCCKAKRVISRMTDSVNCSAFAESMRREICAIERSGAVISPSQNDEIVSVGHSMLRPYKERSRCTDNSSAGMAGCGLRSHPRLPINHPVDFRVAQDHLHIFAGFREWNGLHELGDLIVVGLEKFVLRVADFELLGKELPRFWKNLH